MGLHLSSDGEEGLLRFTHCADVCVCVREEWTPISDTCITNLTTGH